MDTGSTPNGAMQRVRFVVTGLVQGLGFRWFIVRSAQKFGLRGRRVRNLPDDAGEESLVARG